MRSSLPRFRTGRHNPHTIYLQVGPDADDNDVYIGSGRTKGLTYSLVQFANVGLEQMEATNAGNPQVADALNQLHDEARPKPDPE